MPFGLKIAIVSREFGKRMDQRAADLGLTAVQLRVLGSVSRLEAAGETEIHQNDLERIEHVTHPAMTRLLQRLESKGPALSWAAAPTISCAARPTACECLSTQTWTSGRGASWRYMASGRPRLSNASGTRTNAGQPTTGFTPT